MSGHRLDVRGASEHNLEDVDVAFGPGLTAVVGVSGKSSLALDESSRGLHPREVEALVEALEQLRDNGNTGVAVEHDGVFLAKADHVIEIGPASGAGGGELVYAGPIVRARAQRPMRSHVGSDDAVAAGLTETAFNKGCDSCEGGQVVEKMLPAPGGPSVRRVRRDRLPRRDAQRRRARTGAARGGGAHDRQAPAGLVGRPRDRTSVRRRDPARPRLPRGAPGSTPRIRTCRAG